MLSSLKNKYQNIVNECYDDLKPTSTKSETVSDYIGPTKYRISTMTLITSFTCYVNLEVVSKYFKLDDKIISMVYGDKPVKNSKQKGNRPFFNQATIIVKLDPLRKVNVKIFSNGKIQMTGVKHIEEGKEALDIIIKKLKETNGRIPLNKVLDSQLEDIYKDSRKTPHFKDSYPIDNPSLYKERLIFEIEKLTNCNDWECHCIEDIYNFGYEDFQIVLINSDFNINFQIKRNILFSILKDDYNIISRFEPGIYPGVNNKFYWNKLYKNDPSKREGVCYCSKPCSGKGLGDGEGDCKKITIAAFSSGSVIITGARAKKQIDDCYNFINRVFRDNYGKVKKVLAPFYDEKKEQRSGGGRKYVKPSDIIYINPEDIDNQFNESIFEQYRNYISVLESESK